MLGEWYFCRVRFLAVIGQRAARQGSKVAIIRITTCIRRIIKSRRTVYDMEIYNQRNACNRTGKLRYGAFARHDEKWSAYAKHQTEMS